MEATPAKQADAVASIPPSEAQATLQVINPAVQAKAPSSTPPTSAAAEAPPPPHAVREVDLLAALPDRDPLTSVGLLDEADLGGGNPGALEPCWRATGRKQFYLDLAAEVAERFADQRLPVPGALASQNPLALPRFGYSHMPLQ